MGSFGSSCGLDPPRRVVSFFLHSFLVSPFAPKPKSPTMGANPLPTATKISLIIALALICCGWVCLAIWLVPSYATTYWAGFVPTALCCYICFWCVPAIIRLVIWLVRSDGSDDKSLRNVLGIIETIFITLIMICTCIGICATIAIAIIILVNNPRRNKWHGVFPLITALLFIYLFLRALGVVRCAAGVADRWRCRQWRRVEPRRW